MMFKFNLFSGIIKQNFLDVEGPLLCHRLLDVEDSIDNTVCVVNINMGKQCRSIRITSAYYKAQLEKKKRALY